MSGSKNQTVDRALDIVFSLANEKSSMTVSKIAKKVNIPESTVYRLIRTLEQYGLVERRSVGQIWLGARILDLARSFQQQMDQELMTIARPIMEKLTNDVNETSILCMRSVSQIICIQSIETKQILRISVDVGNVLPLYRGAAGKGILAFEHEHKISKWLETINDATLKKQLKTEIEAIQQNGYCLTFEEVEDNIYALSAPVFNRNDEVIASLAIAGPTKRWTKEKSQADIKAVKLAAEEISRQLTIIH